MRTSRIACAVLMALASITSATKAQPSKPAPVQSGPTFDSAGIDCKKANCTSEIAGYAFALDRACTAGACPGPTPPVIPGKIGALILTADKQAQLARGLALVASVYGVSPDQLYQLHKVEAARLSQAAKAKP